MSTKDIYFKPRTTTRRRGPGRPPQTHTALIKGATYVFDGSELKVVTEPPKEDREALNISPGYFTSKDGRKIQVWYINHGSEGFPVIGAIQTDGVWEPRVWNMSGIAKRPYGQVNDIISKWSEG